jgi:tRNA1Val (adenine37-N6)-methyltransferase
MSKPFQFKEFTIHQDKTAMKVGTDGVLLGAWAALHNPFAILDIGTGTGLIALMLAQRSDAEMIDAIEIDNSAFEQAVGNFEESVWNDRLFCYHASLGEFADEIEEKYDMIVSNPPFYTDNFESTDEQRNKARFTSSLSFEQLLENVSKLLSSEGLFSLIIPFKEEEKVLRLAAENKLYPNRICRVRGNESSELKRSLLEFSFQEKSPIINELTIELDRHVYTDDFTSLVKDFYLKM